MSIASDLRAQGLAQLTDPDTGSGETMTFREASIDAIVRYEPEQDPGDGKTNHFDDRGRSLVEIQKGDVETAPTTGEVFTGEDGRRHRIDKRIRETDLSYLCECVLSKPVSDS